MNRKRVVLFVCNHNAGRSQMAEAYLRAMAPDAFEAVSAGSNPANELNPIVAAALKEDGLAVGDARPKKLNLGMTARADVIVTMGCEDGCVARKDEDWALPDPAGQPIERVREIRDQVRAKVDNLVRRLTRPDA